MTADTTAPLTIKQIQTATPEELEVGKGYDGPKGMRFRREVEEVPGEEPSSIYRCEACGVTGTTGPSWIIGHWNFQCVAHPNRAERDAKKADSMESVDFGPVTRSKRGLARRGIDRAPTTLEEIRPRPGGMLGGPAAYFIRPDGATIREALIIYPSGAPVIKNGTDRGNSRYAQDRQKQKGYEYVGPQLTAAGVKRLLEVINVNRYDYLLDLKEQIEECEKTIEETETPTVRDNARKRRGQLQRLVEIAAREVKPESLLKELDDIIKAQKLASIPQSQREAIAIMLGEEVGARIQSLVSKMSSRNFTEDGLSVSVTNAGAGDDF